MSRAERRYMDLGAIFDAHVQAEFVDKDVAATMATMAPEPYLTHVPTLTGGTGRVEVERFYRDHFVGHWPDDVQTTLDKFSVPAAEQTEVKALVESTRAAIVAPAA